MYHSYYVINLRLLVLDQGWIHRGARGRSPPPQDGCWPKNWDASLGDKTCCWSALHRQAIKSRFYHPVSYSAPCCLLITCLDFYSPAVISFCLIQFPFNLTAKIAPKMHQNSSFWAQKSKKIFWGGAQLPLSASVEGDTPLHTIPLHRLRRLNPHRIWRLSPQRLWCLIPRCLHSPS